MQSTEVMETKPSVDQYPINFGNNTARTQMDRVIGSGNKPAMRHESSRQHRIGEERSVGSIFKPYPHRESIENSIDRMGNNSFISETDQSPLDRNNKYFGKKSFS